MPNKKALRLPNVVFCAGVLLLGIPCWAAPRGKTAETAPPFLGPIAVALDSQGKRAYVACADASRLVVVDLEDGRVSATVMLPDRPTAVACLPDGQLAVACASPKSKLVILDSHSLKVIRTITVGHTASDVAVDPTGNRLFVCNRFDNDVSVIDLAQGQEIARVPAVREPVAAAVTPDGRYCVVANHLPLAKLNPLFQKQEVGAAVTVIDTHTLQPEHICLRHGSHGARDVCISPDGRFAFVTHLMGNFEMIPYRVDAGWINVNVVSIIDIAKREVAAAIGMDDNYQGSGNPWGIAVADNGQWVAVAGSGIHQLLLIKTDELLGDHAFRTMQPMMAVWPIYLSLGESLWRRVALPGNGPRAVAAHDNKVYVAEYFSDTLAVVTLGEGGQAQVTTIPLGPAPRPTLARKGEMLFHDATLCYQNWQSCASCHSDGRTDGLNWDLLNDGSGNPKNTRSLLLSYETPPLMASGVRPDLTAAIEAGMTHILFGEPKQEHIAAIEAYLRSLKPEPSPHLRDGKLSPLAQKGRQLFFSSRVGCWRCHPEPLYTDGLLHDVGTRNPLVEYRQRFDAPTLIEVWRTAPYLHDGRYLTIEELLREGRHGLKHLREPLTNEEIRALAEFVLSL